LRDQRSTYAARTERTDHGEHLVFWHMVIVSAGTMWQWGRHSTAFLATRHFDDADLIERHVERVAAR
jgi:hypothetical protein